MDDTALVEKWVSKFLETSPMTAQWYIIIGPALAAIGKMEAIADVYDGVERQINSNVSSPEGRKNAIIKAVIRLKDALLKAAFLTGIPRTLMMFNILDQTIRQRDPALLAAITSSIQPRDISSQNMERNTNRGKAFFDSIYTVHGKKLLSNMANYYPGLERIAIDWIYGLILSDDSINSLKETCMIEFVACLAQDAEPQAKGHYYGCLNNGVTDAEVRSLRDIVLEMCQDSGINLTRVQSEKWFRTMDENIASTN